MNTRLRRGSERRASDGGPGAVLCPPALLCAAALSLTACALAASSASAAVGDIAWQGCVTGNKIFAGSAGTDACSAGTDACANIPTAVDGGEGSGLAGPTTVAVSPDGDSVYVGSGEGITTFERGADGTLTRQGCITGNQGGAGSAGTQACVDSGGATSNGADSGAGSLGSVAVSPDGKSVYAASLFDDAVASFDRAAGKLTWQGCITGDLDGAGSGGTHACDDGDGATANGVDSGLKLPIAVAVSPDDESVYVAAQADAAVTSLDRAADGSLSDAGCITGNMGGSGSTGTHACDDSDGATADGGGSGLDSPRWVAVSPDGKSVYVAAGIDAAVASFDRAAGGSLTWQSM